MATKNVKKATATGIATGAGGGSILVWLSSYLASKWTMPVEVVGVIISPVLAIATGWLSRWASKLNPDR